MGFYAPWDPTGPKNRTASVRSRPPVAAHANSLKWRPCLSGFSGMANVGPGFKRASSDHHGGCPRPTLAPTAPRASPEGFTRKELNTSRVFAVAPGITGGGGPAASPTHPRTTGRWSWPGNPRAVLYSGGGTIEARANVLADDFDAGACPTRLGNRLALFTPGTLADTPSSAEAGLAD